MDTKTIATIAAVGILSGGASAGAVLVATAPEKAPGFEVVNERIELDGRVLQEIKVENERAENRVAVIKDGVVVNSVVVPRGWILGGNGWQPPADATIMFSNNASPGDLVEGDEFTRKVLVQVEEREEDTSALSIDELKEKDELTKTEQERILRYLIEKDTQ